MSMKHKGLEIEALKQRVQALEAQVAALQATRGVYTPAFWQIPLVVTTHPATTWTNTTACLDTPTCYYSS